MKKRRLIFACFALLAMCTLSAKAASYTYLSWNGTEILGKASIGSFSAAEGTTLTITNNVTLAHGTPTAWDARLSLRKKGFWGYSSVYDMTQQNVAKKTWYYTLTASGTYDMYFSSYKIAGITNPLDMNGGIN